MLVATSTDQKNANVPAGAPRTAQVGACLICGDLNSALFFNSSDRLHATPGVFTYRRCPTCETIFQDPQVIGEDLSLCYPLDYFTHDNPGDTQTNSTIHRDRWLGKARERIRVAITNAVRGVPDGGVVGLIGKALSISRHLRERAFFDRLIDELLPGTTHSRTALDVGCGAGQLMASLRDAGWEVTGVEWDPNAAGVARNTSGLSVFEGDFRDVQLPLGRYDLVTLSHVFEHVDDPSEALRRIGALLKPGGRAVLTYPNPNSLGARVFGSDWSNWDPPRHLVIPSLPALDLLAQANGLTLVCSRTSARNAAPFFAVSRELRMKHFVDLKSVQVHFVDKLLGAVARALVFIGFPVGEEIFAVVQSDSRQDRV